MNFSSVPFFNLSIKDPAKIDLHVKPGDITDFCSFVSYIFELDLPQCKIPQHNFEFLIGAGNTFHESKYVVREDIIPLRNVKANTSPHSPHHHFVPGGSSVALKRIHFSSLRAEEEGLHQAALISRRLKAVSLEI